jgi:hypothetical protein
MANKLTTAGKSIERRSLLQGGAAALRGAHAERSRNTEELPR